MLDVLTVPSLPDMVVSAGLDAIGTPYVWGGDDPVDGFDCSGLTQFVFRETAGIDLPRTAREQRHEGKDVKRQELKPGDLVFFNTTRRRTVSHVGIYIGQNQFVHAPTRGSKVRVDSMNNSYWSKRYIAARRFIDTPSGHPTFNAQLLAQAEISQ
jgi:cell wall-associated NlpC family hydrolase